jgi:hypothetical protein
MAFVEMAVFEQSSSSKRGPRLERLTFGRVIPLVSQLLKSAPPGPVASSFPPVSSNMENAQISEASLSGCTQSSVKLHVTQLF